MCLIICKILKAIALQTVNVYGNIPRVPALYFSFEIPAVCLDPPWVLFKPL